MRQEMETHDLEKMAIAAYLMSLKELSLIELAALNNAAQTATKVHSENLAFDKAVDLGIINEDGTFHDLLRSALARQVMERLS